MATGAGKLGSVEALSSIAIVDRVVDLVAIFDPSISAVLLRRGPLPLADELAALAAPTPHTLVVSARDATRVVPAELPAAPVVGGDLGELCEVLGELIDAAQLGIWIATLQAPMCPRFHVDRVGLRVVVTYAGPGTELLDSAGGDRAGLGPHGDDARVVRDAGAIVRAQAGDVVVLKGEAWPGNAGRGAMHRSPPGTAPRLVATLDPLG